METNPQKDTKLCNGQSGNIRTTLAAVPALQQSKHTEEEEIASVPLIPVIGIGIDGVKLILNSHKIFPLFTQYSSS